MFVRFSSILLSAVLLAGCVSAPQLAVPLAPTTFTATQNRVGVIMMTLPVVDTHFPGASCLLCMAAASVANSTLTEYTKTLPYEDLSKLNMQVANHLKKKGMEVTFIDKLDFPSGFQSLPDFDSKEPNFAKKDFSSLQAKYKIDKLLVIDIGMLGIERTYSAYFPTSEPKAKIAGISYIINLKNNAYEWYFPLNIVKSSDANWDEPPKFPGLTNAYFQVLELTKDSFISELSQ
jgi:hypothetical protein